MKLKSTPSCFLNRIAPDFVRSVRVLLLVGLIAGAAAPDPAPGPVRIIGGPTTGCIAGAVELPPEGTGYRTIHPAASAFWGAPSTIATVQELGRRARSAGIGDLYVEEISKPRGGLISGVHASHQTGLDIDIGLDTRQKPDLTPAQRETVELPTLVRPDRRFVLEDRWSPATATLLRLAAELPEIDRVLVNPAIKRKLCDSTTGDRAWLRRIRPWYGHAAHMHVHLRCPADQVDCVSQLPPPAGDGCDASLAWWFEQLDAPSPPSSEKPKPLPPISAACRVIFAGAKPF